MFQTKNKIFPLFLQTINLPICSKINEDTRKTTTKTWLAMFASMCTHRTRLACNNACNTYKTTSLSVIWDFVN